jgi:hypothetical protein
MPTYTLSVSTVIFVPDHTQGYKHSHTHTHTHTHTQSVGLSRREIDPRRKLYLIAHNTQKKQTSMPPPEFEPATSASELPQTNALDRAATGPGGHFTPE